MTFVDYVLLFVVVVVVCRFGALCLLSVCFVLCVVVCCSLFDLGGAGC